MGCQPVLVVYFPPEVRLSFFHHQEFQIEQQVRHPNQSTGMKFVQHPHVYLAYFAHFHSVAERGEWMGFHPDLPQLLPVGLYLMFVVAFVLPLLSVWPLVVYQQPLVPDLLLLQTAGVEENLRDDGRGYEVALEARRKHAHKEMHEKRDRHINYWKMFNAYTTQKKNIGIGIVAKAANFPNGAALVNSFAKQGLLTGDKWRGILDKMLGALRGQTRGAPLTLADMVQHYGGIGNVNELKSYFQRKSKEAGVAYQQFVDQQKQRVTEERAQGRSQSDIRPTPAKKRRGVGAAQSHQAASRSRPSQGDATDMLNRNGQPSVTPSPPPSRPSSRRGSSVNSATGTYSAMDGAAGSVSLQLTPHLVTPKPSPKKPTPTRRRGATYDWPGDRGPNVPALSPAQQQAAIDARRRAPGGSPATAINVSGVPRARPGSGRRARGPTPPRFGEQDEKDEKQPEPARARAPGRAPGRAAINPLLHAYPPVAGGRARRIAHTLNVSLRGTHAIPDHSESPYKQTVRASSGYGLNITPQLSITHLGAGHFLLRARRGVTPGVRKHVLHLLQRVRGRYLFVNGRRHTKLQARDVILRMLRTNQTVDVQLNP